MPAAIVSSIVVAAAFAAPASPQQPAEDPDESPGREQSDAAQPAGVLDTFLDEVRSLQADFVQQLHGADGRLMQTSSGSLALSRPGRFRWHYEQPFDQLVVADGKNLWIYDVELEQVTVTPLDDDVASTPAMLLSGDRAVRDGFDVVERFERDGLEWVRLAPNLQGTDFMSVLIGFRDTTPQRLELVDGLNQTTEIELSNVAVNPELDEDLFEFDPPRRVDVIGTPR
ncbi:MAG TPA: outer membrane lipoprotein chaperone LolA [Gammaproteobacteria bacterium]